MQVFEEPGLVNGHQWAKAHGHGRKLPKLGHELGVWVAGKPIAIHLLAEVEQLLFGQAAFQVGAGINTWGNVALYI